MNYLKPKRPTVCLAFCFSAGVFLSLFAGCSAESESGRSEQAHAEPASERDYVADDFAPSIPVEMPPPAAEAMPLDYPPAMTAPSMTARSMTAPSMTAPGSASTVRVAPHPSAPSESASSVRMEMSVPPSFEVQPEAARIAGAPNAGAPNAGAPNEKAPNEDGFATVQVFYATDRDRSPIELSNYQLSGQTTAFVGLTGMALLLFAFGAMSWLRGRTQAGNLSMLAGGLLGCLAAAMVVLGQSNIEKHGVTYTSDRGQLVRGVCEVTVPDSHQRGLVERPSLLHFEVREDQQKHVVLTSAIELGKTDFQQRMSSMIAKSPERDLLVFIHGYNVDFESAVLRTAQIAVDLPFEGVPVCYSWPSQASLMGYTIDENNSEWTIYHLKQFLLELAEESGADSINVVAHSMGNRAMTAAIEQIRYELDPRDRDSVPMFDRIVLAAPDVDADRFRRDLAPALLEVSNQVTLYASSDDQALIASKTVHGYPRAGESGANIVVVPGVETIDVSGIDLSLLGHSYYGDNESMLRDLYELVRKGLPAAKRNMLLTRRDGEQIYWQLAQQPSRVLR
ncbi:hypothetical protein Q31b_36710 [Novipirellula aureliae]|uniref:Alpha/beta hydrolase family protein n=1 Tax=Novipirellula aureliae TaxID=2527966 RepID=A0A5C6DSJ6_9BACT|nr:alpha/beta hydrolase [Novipirellula aureliae]TWU40323.1 hypothetical protein Q31b_36710 [Novipirellula aureliae]